MSNLSAAIGHIAAVLTTFAFVPQVMRIWRTRSTTDISLGMYSLYPFGIALWGVYGILIDLWPIILANCLTFLLAASVLVMKVKFGRTKE